MIEEAILGDETVIIDPKHFKHIGQFQLIEFLGQGAFGAVWKARDLDLDRFVALKIPRRDQFDERTFGRFTHEAQAAAQVRHPNIVSVYEIGREGDRVYIASEYIEGVSLRDRLASHRYDFRATAQLVADLAEALHAAHEAGVVHRDLKPSNVLIDSAGRPYLTDFGLAKRESAEITVTADGQVLGTIAYMSPEQARGHSHQADRRSDVYSLGVMLYEMLCGQRPFHGGKSRLLLYQILNDQPPPPRKSDRRIPRDLETICLKALEKDPEKRYATAREMAQDLKRYLRQEPIRARPVSRSERAWRWSRRNPALAASISVALLATVLWITAVLQRDPSPISESLRVVRLSTTPPRATVVFFPLDPVNGDPQPERALYPKTRSPVEVELPAGDYLVVAVSPVEEFTFHEVYRRVPATTTHQTNHKHNKWTIAADGAVELPPITLPPAGVTKGMIRFDGSERLMIGSPVRPEVPPHPRSIPAFLLDAEEVRFAAFQTALPLFDLKPRFLQAGIHPTADEAAAFVTWDDAAAYAEKIGKRLPDEWEYEFAATLGGTRKFPWGDAPQQFATWEFGEVGIAAWDRVPTDPPVVGLFSNLAEWTCSWATAYPAHRMLGMPPPEAPREQRVVRGAAYSAIRGAPDPVDLATSDPRGRIVYPRDTWIRTIGFRCARSLRPRLRPEDFGREIAE